MEMTPAFKYTLLSPADATTLIEESATVDPAERSENKSEISISFTFFLGTPIQTRCIPFLWRLAYQGYGAITTEINNVFTRVKCQFRPI
jgi:hypothetical protein